MKKFFAFAIAMAMTVVANAGLVVEAPATATEGETVTITITSDEIIGLGFGDFTLAVTGAEFSNPAFATVTSFADYAWSVAPGFVNTGSTLSLNATSAAQGNEGYPFAPQAGSALSFDLVKGADDIVITQTLGSFEGSYDKIADIVVTPEPMTMSLLGLGGLVAARRRRA